MPENDLSPRRGISRRTVLKASAWSAPIVAVAAATPLASASVAGVDAMIYTLTTSLDFVFSGDRSRLLELSVPTEATLRVNGSSPAPAGATLAVRFDNRLMGGLSMTADGVPVPGTPETVNGDTATAVFTLPVPIPAGQDLPLAFTFERKNVTYLPDAIDSVFTLASPGDPDEVGNTSTAVHVERESFDASLTMTYQERTATAGGTWHLVETATITAVGPGAVPNPTLTITSAPDVTANVTATSVLLDGASRPDLLTSEAQGSGRFAFSLSEPLPAGSTLHLVFDTELNTAETPEFPVLPTNGRVDPGWPGHSGDRNTADNEHHPF